MRWSGSVWEHFPYFTYEAHVGRVVELQAWDG